MPDSQRKFYEVLFLLRIYEWERERDEGIKVLFIDISERESVSNISYQIY